MRVTNNENQKLLPYLTMFSMTIKLITVIMIYKITKIGGYNISASTLIIPFWFVTGDIIAELYGYRIARNIILFTILLQIAFGCFISVLTTLPYSNLLNNNQLYDDLFSNMLRVSAASSIGLLIGGLYNAYLMVYIRDKLFIKLSFTIRAILASSISELLFTIVVYSIEFYNSISVNSTLQLILISFIFKQLISPILTICIASP